LIAENPISSKGRVMWTRRDFSKTLLTGGATLFAPGGSWGSESSTEMNTRRNGEYDLLIKGGMVVDPGQQLHALRDVAVKNGKILNVAEAIEEKGPGKVISARGLIVTPGLIDIHVHCYDGVATGINADHYCLRRGVTTVVDAGSAGYPMIANFRKRIMGASITRTYAFVDIGALGTVVGTKDTMDNLDWVNPKLTAAAVEENRPSVVGIKVRLAKSIQGAKDLECLRRAIEAAEATQLPVMAHIDEPYSPLSSILKLLRKGDIFTHYLNNHANGILDASGTILPEVLEARNLGVIFDPAQGRTHLSFDVTEKCLHQNFLPDTISTDLNLRIVDGPVYDLPTTVSKFMALGLTLEKAIELATVRPTKLLNFGVRTGALRPEYEADIAVFELREGKFEFADSDGVKRWGQQRLYNKVTVCRGQLFPNE